MKHLKDTEKWKLLQQTNEAKSKGAALEYDVVSQDLGVAYMTETIQQLSSDSAADLLRSFPVDFSTKILNNLPGSQARDLREILSYPENSAGSIMAKEFLAISACTRINQAIELLQKIPNDRKGRVPYVYILDKDNRLDGVVSIKDLIFNAPDTLLNAIAARPALSVSVNTKQEAAAQLIREQNHLAIPVVDPSGRMTGIISANNVLQFMKDQADQDIAKMVGTDAEEMTSHSPLRILRLRMPWLLFSLASGLFCAFISEVFQRHMVSIAVLFIFVPVVLGISESTGIQGATIIVRNMGMQSMSFKELSRLMGREILVGIMIGIICGVIVGIITSFWQGNSTLGIAIAVSMNVAVIFSALIGLTLPVLFRKMKMDPAVASGPLVLALCDIQTLGVYFFLAGKILQSVQ